MVRVGRLAIRAGSACLLLCGMMLATTGDGRADDALHFELIVTTPGLGPSVVSGQVVPDHGAFKGFFNQSGVRLMLYGHVDGDAISVGGTLKTGYLPAPDKFSVAGRFTGDKFESGYLTTGGVVESYRGTIVVTRSGAPQ